MVPPSADSGAGRARASNARGCLKQGFFINVMTGRRRRRRHPSAAERDRGGEDAPSSAVDPAPDRPTPPLRCGRRAASATARDGRTRRRRTREERVKRHCDHGRRRSIGDGGASIRRQRRRVADRIEAHVARRLDALRGDRAPDARPMPGTNGGAAESERGTDFAVRGRANRRDSAAGIDSSRVCGRPPSPQATVRTDRRRSQATVGDSVDALRPAGDRRMGAEAGADPRFIPAVALPCAARCRANGRRGFWARCAATPKLIGRPQDTGLSATCAQPARRGHRVRTALDGASAPHKCERPHRAAVADRPDALAAGPACVADRVGPATPAFSGRRLRAARRSRPGRAVR